MPERYLCRHLFCCRYYIIFADAAETMFMSFFRCHDDGFRATLMPTMMLLLRYADMLTLPPLYAYDDGAVTPRA